jgi:hypothetical protein
MQPTPILQDGPSDIEAPASGASTPPAITPHCKRLRDLLANPLRRQSAKKRKETHQGANTTLTAAEALLKESDETLFRKLDVEFRWDTFQEEPPKKRLKQTTNLLFAGISLQQVCDTIPAASDSYISSLVNSKSWWHFYSRCAWPHTRAIIMKKWRFHCGKPKGQHQSRSRNVWERRVAKANRRTYFRPRWQSVQKIPRFAERNTFLERGSSEKPAYLYIYLLTVLIGNGNSAHANIGKFPPQSPPPSRANLV